MKIPSFLVPKPPNWTGFRAPFHQVEFHWFPTPPHKKSLCNLSNLIATLVGILIYFSVIRNEALRVAFIHVEESGAAEGKVSKEFYSKLVKADIHGKDQVNDFSFFIDLYFLSNVGLWVFIAPCMLPISFSESKIVITSAWYTLACNWWNRSEMFFSSDEQVDTTFFFKDMLYIFCESVDGKRLANMLFVSDSVHVDFFFT